MKKLVSALIVLAIVMAMLPAAAIAVVPASEADYTMSIGFGEYIELLAEDEVSLKINTGDQKTVLKVNGEGSYYDWYIDNGMQKFYPNMLGFYELELEASTSYTLYLVSDTSFDDQSLYVSVDAYVVGTEDRPDTLVLGENSATVDGMSPYFYKWTATESGELTVTVDTSKCSDWSFGINVNKANGSVKYGDTHYSDLEPVEPAETVAVSAGDECIINVCTANWGSSGTIYFAASFVPGEVDGGDGEGGEGGEGGGALDGNVVASNTVLVNSASGEEYEDRYEVVEFTAPAEGTVTITISSAGAGWSMMVYQNEEPITIMMTRSSEMTYEYPVMAGDTLKFEMGAYDSTVGWCPVDDEITYVITFDAGEVEIVKEPYLTSDTVLYLGSNDLTMIENAENTLFEFAPTQTGVYVFTAPEGILIGNWGQFFNPMDNTGENKTNTLVWTCTAVGQSIMVGVAGEENIVLEVVRSGDYVPPQEVEWTEYENTANLFEFELDPDADLIPVDVTDDVADSAVLGADGFYHLNSVDGPILLIDLNQYVLPATGYGKVSYIVKDENGNVISKTNYTNAVLEYAQYCDGGLYPVTADLIAFYKNFGSNQGWYDPNQLLGFYLFGDDVVDPETAWMFACYYDEDTTAFMSEYYVAGESGLCGSTWTPGDAANQMVVNADGTCSITYNNVAPGKYMFKVTQTDWSMDNWGGNGPDGNYVIEVGVETFVTITFDPANGAISVVTGENGEFGDYSIAGLVVAMMAATAGVVVLSKKKEF